jgi:hypothetical protein
MVVRFRRENLNKAEIVRMILTGKTLVILLKGVKIYKRGRKTA